MNAQSQHTAIKKRPILLIVLGSILGVCCLCIGASLAMSALGLLPTNVSSSVSTEISEVTIVSPATSTTNVLDTRCVSASPKQMESIRAGVKDIQASNDVLQGFAVRSNDFEKVWFVAAEITGPSIKPKEAIGIWAINGELETPGIVLSVNGFATEFSPYPDASKTDAHITQFDDGAPEALACARAGN